MRGDIKCAVCGQWGHNCSGINAPTAYSIPAPVSKDLVERLRTGCADMRTTYADLLRESATRIETLEREIGANRVAIGAVTQRDARIETLERSVADLRSALDRVSAAWDECLSSGCNIGDAERIMSGPIEDANALERAP